MQDLKHWCSAKAEFQALHDFFDSCEDQNSDVLIDGLFCNDSRKVSTSGASLSEQQAPTNDYRKASSSINF